MTRATACVALIACSVPIALISARQAGWPVPEEARTAPNPVVSSSDVIEQGRELFQRNCQRCHGEAGRGDGPAARVIRPSPPDISSPDAQDRMTDGEIFYKISEGRTPMPAMKSMLPEEDRWKIVHFVRTLRPAEAAAAPDPVATADPSDASQLVRSWFDRWNALDETPETQQALVDLYEADALHTTGPASHQLGTVVYRGHAAIRKLAADFVQQSDNQAFRIDTVTEHEDSAQLFNMSSGPWGGPSVAVEFVGVYTSREDGKRYVCPGAAFFQIVAGRIHRLRIYMATGELAEVEPDL